jgi:hypothetical protein
MNAIKILGGLTLALLLGSMTSAVAREAPQPAQDGLTLHDEGDVLTISFDGRAGPVGVPSWKVVLKRADGGNISALHVPADSPRMLSAREKSLWPLAALVASTREDLKATMTRGREAFARFMVDTFEVVEKSPAKIVVRIGGPSRHKHYEHYRTYTFTPGGVQIEGEVLALVDLRAVGLWSFWDRRQIADSHIAAVPMRTQGRPSWVYMPSTGIDRAKPLPAGAAYPLEIELRLRRPTPIFVRYFIDRNFEPSDSKPVLIHNDKDMVSEKSYEKVISFSVGAVAKGQRQTYQVRFQFESQQWP